jgi:hypothetical protein
MIAPVLLALSFLTAADFPQAEIANGLIKAKVYLPDPATGYYRATRFDWSGAVSSLEYQNHNFFGVWFPRYDPKLHDSITGPVEEFRTGESALGYDEAKPGETFIRIGVGVLRKPEEPKFQQFKTYEIVDPGKWSVRTGPEFVEFTQNLTGPNGYAYRYRKTIRLTKDKPQMTIEHTLENTGKQVIATNVYSHNFYVIDGQPTGPDFTVKFPFDIKAAADFHGLAETRGGELAYLQTLAPTNQSVYSELTGFGSQPSDFDIRVENKKVGAGVRLTGDRPLYKVVFWSIHTVLCPEPYIDMKIEPGKQSNWRLTYDFYTIPTLAPSASQKIQ